MPPVTFRCDDELLAWMKGRAESKDLPLSGYIEIVMDNVRRQWIAQQADVELKLRAREVAVAGARANPRDHEHGEGA